MKYFKISILFIVLSYSNFSLAQEKKAIDGWKVENKVTGENDDAYIASNKRKSNINVIAYDVHQAKSILKNAFPIKFNTRSPFVLIVKIVLMGFIDGQDVYNYKLKKALEDLHYETSNGITSEMFFGFFLRSNSIYSEDYKTENIANKFSQGFNNQTININTIEDNLEINDGYYFIKKSSEDLLAYTYIKNGKISGGVSIVEDLKGNLYFGILDKNSLSITGNGLIKYKSGINYLGAILKNSPEYDLGNFNGVEFQKPKDNGLFYLPDWSYIMGSIVNDIPQGYAKRLNLKKTETELVFFDKGKVIKTIKQDENNTWKFVEKNESTPATSVKSNINSVSQIPEKLKPFQGVFISTPYGDLWTKIKISGINVKIWNAMPDDGSWGNVDEDCGLKEINGAVRINEERSSVDGSKYYSIYTSNPDGMTYYINYFPTKTQKYTFKVGQSRAYNLRKVQENYNPWK